MFWLSLVALASANDSSEVAAHTAHVLVPGEVMLGTSGVHLGVLPRVQLSTRPLLTFVGFTNAAVKIQPIDHEVFDLSANAYGVSSWLDGLDLRAGGVGLTSSVTYDPLAFHIGGTLAASGVSGIPDTAPTWLTDLYGEDPFEKLADVSALLGLDPTIEAIWLTLRSALEVRTGRRSSIILLGTQSPWSRASARLVDGNVATPSEETQPPTPSWTATVAWQTRLGPLRLRGGVGASQVPFAWIPQAIAAHARFGGKKRDARDDSESHAPPE